MNILPREFYMENTLNVAKKLLGKYLVHRIGGEELLGMIVETEAYIGPMDKACHSYNNKRTPRNETMYGPPGIAYVYIIYGMYYCLNVVTAEENKPEAVLIRAIEPIKGVETMAKNRYNIGYQNLTKVALKNLTNGPGKICKALGIDRSHDGEDLCKDRLFITEGIDIEDVLIETSPRINVDYAEEAKYYPWRYYIKDNPFVSHRKRGKA